MMPPDTARALKLINDELPRVLDRWDREKVADQILGALQSHFLVIPLPTVAEEAETRADLATIDIPGFHDFIPPTKGRT
jgi:hypothetical protein